MTRPSPVAMLLPFARGSATSRAAAVAADHRMFTDKERIFRLIFDSPDGMTSDEVFAACPDLAHQCCAARISQMYSRDGVLRPSGRTRLTRSKRPAVVWVVEPTPLYKPRRPLRPNKVIVGEALAEIRSLLETAGHHPSPSLRALTGWLVGTVRKDGGL